ncbi:MAG: hypothetical protein IPI67_37965 [Myxococcales bacterium]|nr:hypothetical protein [Myxococcales bacterium]
MAPRSCRSALGLTLLALLVTSACSDSNGIESHAPKASGGAAAKDASTSDAWAGAGGIAGEAGSTGVGGAAGSSGAAGSGAGADAGVFDSDLPGCGDSVCSAGESCASCSVDCGACPTSCGDASCNAGETCSSCPGDCGACPPTCGDGACNGSESCSTCSLDCGACLPTCGNGSCETGESCATCPADCVVAACPAPTGVKEGGGLKAINTCAFPMADTNVWTAQGAIVSGLAAVLTKRSVSYVVGDANRQGVAVSSVPGLSSVHRGMRWDTGDVNVTYWIPQGISGSGDSIAAPIGGKSIVLVSWYYDGASPDKGVRIAFVDAATKKYRFALLVEPYMNGTRPDFKAFVSHAGGIAWYGNYLYVAQTSQGFRVFDMSRILQVATDADTIGYSSGAGVYRAHKYKYVIPQIGAYKHESACVPVFSFAALDRATSPPSLVSGEYVAGQPNGRLYRWSLDPATGRLAGGNLFVPKEAFYSGQNNNQGAVPAYGRWLLSSSAPANGKGALYRTAVGSSSTYAWTNAPEDLYIDVSTGELWGLSEAQGARYVFSQLVSKYK